MGDEWDDSSASDDLVICVADLLTEIAMAGGEAALDDDLL